MAVIFKDPGAARTGTPSRLRKCRHHRRTGKRACIGRPWRGTTHGEVRLAAGIHRNWIVEFGMAARMDEMDATRRGIGAVRFDTSSRDRYFATAVLLGHHRGPLLYCLQHLF